MILKIPMIALEKSHQNLSDYNQSLLKNRLEVNKKHIFSSEKIRNSGKCSYEYVYSLVFRRGFLIQCAILPCKIYS